MKSMKPDKDFEAAKATAVNAPSTAVAADQLLAFIERVEALEAEKAEIADGVKAVFAEAKATGFDTRTMRHVIALRRKSAEERDEEMAMLDLYLHALDMTPEPAS